MSDSILTSTKKILGIEEAYEAFDPDIITHINSAFFTLSQLGLGPTSGFMITDKTTTWVGLFGTIPELDAIKQYVYLRVRTVFDPPTSSYAVEAMKEQIKEHEWRLSVSREDVSWTDPDPVLTDPTL